MAKNHKMYHGQLLQMNKSFSSLKRSQQEKINGWLKEEYKREMKKHGASLDKNQKEQIVSTVYEKIQQHGIWIPCHEIRKYFKSRLPKWRLMYVKQREAEMKKEPAYSHGGEIYDKQVTMDYSTNVNPYGMPEEVKKAIVDHLEEYARYPDDAASRLSAAIGKQYGLNPAWVICGNGAADLIYRFCLALKIKKAMVLAPSFSEYAKAVELSGGQVFYYDLKEEEDFCVDEGILTAMEGMDAVFLCNPNNPVGNMIDYGLMERIAAKAKELGTRLMVDECFLEFTDREGESLIGRVSENSMLFVLKAFTKVFGMAGIRLGYGLCRDEELLMAMKKAGAPWSVSTVAQEAGMAALAARDFVLETVEAVKKEGEFLRECLKTMGIRMYPSNGNFILFKSYAGLYEDMLSRGILLRQCGNYRGLSREYYRISVGLPEHNLKLLSCLRECLEENRREEKAWRR